MATFGPARRAWPVLAAFALTVSALAMLATAAFLYGQRDQAKQVAAQVHVQLAQMAERARLQPVAALAPAAEPPLLLTHLSDVETLLRLSEQKGVSIGTLQIRSDPGPDPSYRLRVVEFRVEEDYPKLKAYLADLLSRFPHLYLDELRIDQGSDPGGKVQATLRLSLVYRPSPHERARADAVEALR